MNININLPKLEGDKMAKSISSIKFRTGLAISMPILAYKLDSILSVIMGAG